jgi:hypothetical protein
MAARHWGSDSSVPDRSAWSAFPAALPGSAEMAPAPPFLPAEGARRAEAPLRAGCPLRAVSPSSVSRQASPEMDRHPIRRRRRQSERRRLHNRLHNYYSIRTGKPGVLQTNSYGESRRRHSRRRGLRTLSPARRRAASPWSLNETNSCAVPLSQSIPEREQMTGVVDPPSALRHPLSAVVFGGERMAESGWRMRTNHAPAQLTGQIDLRQKKSL